ncbi:MAG: TolC family protein [Chitinophagales bacterium]
MTIHLVARTLNICLIFFILLAAAAPTATAQTSQMISLDQAIKMGTDYSHQLEASRGRYDYTKAKHDQTYDLAYPVTGLSASYYRLSDVPEFYLPGTENALFQVYQNSYQGHVSLNELVFAGFRVKTAKEAADKNLQSAQYDLKTDNDNVKLNIINAYYNLYKVQKAVGIIYQNKKLIDARVTDVLNLEKNGLATHNDVLRLQLQQSNIELTKIDAENILQNANYDFNLLIGLSGNVEVVLDSTTLFSPKTVTNQDDYITAALQTRPDIQSASLHSQVAEDNLKIAQRSYYPTLGVGGDLFPASPNQRYVPPTDAFHTTWDVGVTLNWNITNLFTNQHVIAENQALLDQSKAQQLQLNDNVKSEVYQDYLSFKESLDKISVLTKAVDQAQENLRVTESRYNNSLALVSDLTDAQSAQIQAQINLVIANADAQIAYYRLQKSSGNF